MQNVIVAGVSWNLDIAAIAHGQVLMHSVASVTIMVLWKFLKQVNDLFISYLQLPSPCSMFSHSNMIMTLLPYHVVYWFLQGKHHSAMREIPFTLSNNSFQYYPKMHFLLLWSSPTFAEYLQTTSLNHPSERARLCPHQCQIYLARWIILLLKFESRLEDDYIIGLIHCCAVNKTQGDKMEECFTRASSLSCKN